MSVIICAAPLLGSHPCLATDRVTTLVNPKDPIVLERLVKSLMYAFDLSSFAHLSFVLGYGAYESNDEALIAWIGDHIPDADGIEPSVLFLGLAHALRDVLTAWRISP